MSHNHIGHNYIGRNYLAEELIDLYRDLPDAVVRRVLVVVVDLELELRELVVEVELPSVDTGP